ncbi:MAG TPA: YceI family protein [Thermoanaerobaculia bacterium]|nr:YceI family protein [Thermoanaerobaculia bacterium]
MKNVGLLLALLFAATLSGEEKTRFVPTAPSKLTLAGSSNVAPWRCSGTTLDGRMEVAAPLQRINDIIDTIEDGNLARLTIPSFPPPSFELRIPVATLKCGNRQMERDMTRALRAESYPAIEFHFANVVGGVRHDIDGRQYGARIQGTLSLAGERRNVAIDVVAQRVARDRFRLSARLPMRMSDFRIAPPTALFGMIKANDELVVQFDLFLETRS